MKYKKSLSDDINSKLQDVERGYLRKPVTIILTLVLLLIFIPISVCESFLNLYENFVLPCWNGEPIDD